MKLSIKLLLILVIAIGLGRFIFTPALPIMVEQSAMNTFTGSLTASFNYIGYLLGTMIIVYYPNIINRKSYIICLVLLLISLLAMVFFANSYFWIVIRFIAGFCSAVLFLYVAKISVENIYNINSGIVYSGVGIGIFISGIVFLLINRWEYIWIISFVIAILFSFYILDVEIKNSKISKVDNYSSNKNSKLFKLLVIAYFFEGVGYIIIATYVVGMIKQINPYFSQFIWIIVGISTIPSTILWVWFKRYLYVSTLLLIAFFLQIISGIIPLITTSYIWLIISSLLFGGTFMGITVLTFDFSQNLQIKNGPYILTMFYSIGQILGPLISSLFIVETYSPSFVIACVSLSISVIFILILLYFNKNMQ